MRNPKFTLLALIFQFLAIPLASHAVPITNLYNTGLDAIGNYLPAGGLDGNYNVILSPSGPFTPVAISDAGFPFGPWVPNNPTFSRWIGPNINSQGPAGFYLYRTTFTLPANANLASATITGLWGTDDPGLDIFINGTSTAQISAGFTSLVPFSVTSNFNVGLNTLDFLLQNAGGPTGLRVDRISGNYNIVPEPASLCLAALGIGGMLMRWRV